MASKTKVPPQFSKSLQSAQAGVTNNWPTGVQTINVQQTAYTQQALVSKLGGYVTVFGLPDKLAQQHADAVTAREGLYAEAHAFLVALLQALPAYVGNTEAGLSAFGAKPPKQRTAQTAAQKAVTTQKRNATRVARGTLGKKQKAQIHGTVPSTTTVAAPAATTPPTTPTGSK